MEASLTNLKNTMDNTHHSGKIRQVLLMAMTVVLLVGCSSNSLVIRFMYGRMDNNLNQRILAYAEFDQSQEQEIRRAVNDFYKWHRRNELPRYADFLQRIESGINNGGIDQQLILDHMTEIRDLVEEGFKRSPIADSASFLKNLSDQQVRQIADRFAEQDKEYFEWLEQRKQEGRKDRRVKNIVKNMGRFGLHLNAVQQQIIAEGLERYEGSPMDRFTVWSRWESDFVKLLERRREAEFESWVNAHLDVYQHQMRLTYPERERRNRENSARIIYQVVQNFDQQQKQAFTSKLAQARQTLLAISAG